MNIKLPKEFFMEDKRKNQRAFIENGILKISKFTPFRKVMIEMSYILKGRAKCCYCKKKKTKEEMAIDHVYPSDFGGPTITNNLLPSCKGCNNKKRNMTYDQYMEYLKAEEQGWERLYYKTLQEQQQTIREREHYQIPKKWITEVETEQIVARMDLDDYQGRKYKTLEDFYFKHGFLQRPIVVDRRMFLLDGFCELMVAKNHNIKKVPVIRLDNVEVIL